MVLLKWLYYDRRHGTTFGNKPKFIRGKEQFQRNSPQGNPPGHVFLVGDRITIHICVNLRTKLLEFGNNRGHISTVCRKGAQPWGSEQNVKIPDHALLSDPVSNEQDDDELTIYKLK